MFTPHPSFSRLILHYRIKWNLSPSQRQSAGFRTSVGWIIDHSVGEVSGTFLSPSLLSLLLQNGVNGSCFSIHKPPLHPSSFSLRVCVWACGVCVQEEAAPRTSFFSQPQEPEMRGGTSSSISCCPLQDNFAAALWSLCLVCECVRRISTSRRTEVNGCFAVDVSMHFIGLGRYPWCWNQTQTRKCMCIPAHFYTVSVSVHVNVSPGRFWSHSQHIFSW